jgi:hypothetical protein
MRPSRGGRLPSWRWAARLFAATDLTVSVPPLIHDLISRGACIANVWGDC